MRCFERSRQAGESSQIQDPEEVNFAFLNAPYRLLSGSEVFDGESRGLFCLHLPLISRTQHAPKNVLKESTTAV
jgi:hypothetical protein